MSSAEMTLEQIKNNAPAAFQDYPASTVNKRYSMIKTSELIEPMYDNGWYVTDAQQRKTRKEAWEDKTYHFLRFRHDELKIGDDYVECLITNSHNASSSFKVQLAILRMVCSNGLTVGTDLISPMTLQHRGLSQEFIAEISQLYVEKMANTVRNSTDIMKNKFLTDDAQFKFAAEAGKLKHKDEYEVDVNGLLLPKRREDYNTDLWTIYNVVQENLIGGTYQIFGKNGWRNARKVSSPASNIEINTKLFNMAMEVAA